jgi:hypothetical protein
MGIIKGPLVCAGACIAALSDLSFTVSQHLRAVDKGPLAAAGACIAALSDLSFNLYGYAAVLGNDFLTALYLILVKNTPAINGLTTTGLLFYNSGAEGSSATSHARCDACHARCTSGLHIRAVHAWQTCWKADLVESCASQQREERVVY